MSPRFSEIRAKFLKAEALRDQVIEALDTQEDLTAQVKQSAAAIENARVLAGLEALPVDRLRDATETIIKIEYLRRSGFENMRQIYEASASRIASVNGISPEVAREIKEIAESMRVAIAETVETVISPELASDSEIELVRALDELGLVNS
jgi:ERCC4-type nuclease